MPASPVGEGRQVASAGLLFNSRHYFIKENLDCPFLPLKRAKWTDFDFSWPRELKTREVALLPLWRSPPEVQEASAESNHFERLKFQVWISSQKWTKPGSRRQYQNGGCCQLPVTLLRLIVGPGVFPPGKARGPAECHISLLHIILLVKLSSKLPVRGLGGGGTHGV